MTIEQAYERIGKKIIKEARQNLTKGHHNRTYTLYKSLQAIIDKRSLNFDMENYGYWVDQGRKTRGITKPTYFFTNPFNNSESEIDKIASEYADDLLEDML